MNALRSILLFVGLLPLSLVAHASDSPSRGEPTSAEEAAAKKAAAARAIEEKYHDLVASLPWDFVKDDPALPRILLIGDSVSRGYTQAVRRELAGKVNVHRAPANCGPTATGLKKLDAWLGDGEWDVIHFNFGIHDRRTPLHEYEQRLSEIIDRLEATGARVVWATTTPIPEDWKEGPDVARGMEERNTIAAELMREREISINDLHSTIEPHLDEVQNPADVHFTAEGYDILGKQVARHLLSVLDQS
jgi:hypothetical protein